MLIFGRHPNSARRVEVSLAARGFRECWALAEIGLNMRVPQKKL